jgi:tRNA uracil 4-sulfurtransferase
LKKAILLHYHEINLKGNNRGWFENRLYHHVCDLLSGLSHGAIQRFGARMFIELGDDSPVLEILERLGRVFGIANLALACEVPADLEAIRAALPGLIKGKSFSNFRIDTRRGTKEFPLNSHQVNCELGGFVMDLTGAAVRLDNPDLTIHVEIVLQRAFIYFEKIAGAGGLPSGTGGKVLCLISGGIDSPVAAFRLMRRGCQILFLHFHSFPHSTAESQEKVRRLVQILARFQLDARLFMVPFADVQREIVAYAPAPMRVVLYRRFMMRIAERLAYREKAVALATGDSLGQVASQTLENIRTISSAIHMPVFRPLVGDDKEDIVRLARRIGTYETSILPDQDCCTLFIPPHPETMSSVAQAERAEAAMDVPQLVQNALSSVSREIILPDYSPPIAGRNRQNKKAPGGQDSAETESSRS